MDKKRRKPSTFFWTREEDLKLKKIYKMYAMSVLLKQFPNRNEWGLRERAKKLNIVKTNNKNTRSMQLVKYYKKINELTEKLISKNDIDEKVAYKKAKEIIDAEDKEERLKVYKLETEYMNRVNKVEKKLDICILCMQEEVERWDDDFCSSCLEKIEAHENKNESSTV